MTLPAYVLQLLTNALLAPCQASRHARSGLRTGRAVSF